MKERCNIGCGCGRNRPSKSQRNKLISKRRSSSNIRFVSSESRLSVKKDPITNPQKRILICKTCPYGKQTSREKKVGILVCHKTNRLIKNLLKDSTFNCPMRKWG